MQAEELAVKLRVDQSGVANDLQQFRNNVAGATDHAAKSFMHVESAGRSFKKLFHEIAQESPLLGMAIRLAFDPVVAVLVGATMAIKAFSESQREAAEEAKKAAKETAEAWAEAQEAKFSKNPSKVLAERTKEKAKTAATTPATGTDETEAGAYLNMPLLGYIPKAGLAMGLWLNDYAEGEGGKKPYFGKALKKYAAYMDEKYGFSRQKAEEDKIAEMRNKTNRATYESALKRTQTVEKREEKEKSDKEVARLTHETMANEDEARGKTMAPQQRLAQLTKDREELMRIVTSKRQDELTRAKAANEISKLDKELVNIQKEVKNEGEKKRIEALQKEAAGKKDQIAKANKMAKYMPTVEELEKQGFWNGIFIGGPDNANAHAILELERRAHYILSRGGDKKVAYDLIYGKGGAEELRKNLEWAGIIRPDITNKQLQEDMAALREMASKSGIKVFAEE